MTGAERVTAFLSRVYDRGLAPSTELTALLTAYGAALDTGEADVAAALAELLLSSANAEWLDLWGACFEVPRTPLAESDTTYRARIIRETTRLRTTPQGLEQVVEDALPGVSASTDEPLRRALTLSAGGVLSGWKSCFPDQRVVHGAVVRLTTLPIPVDRVRITSVVERSRAMGRLVVYREGVAQLAAFGQPLGLRTEEVWPLEAAPALGFLLSAGRASVLSGLVGLDGRRLAPPAELGASEATIGMRSPYLGLLDLGVWRITMGRTDVSLGDAARPGDQAPAEVGTTPVGTHVPLSARALMALQQRRQLRRHLMTA